MSRADRIVRRNPRKSLFAFALTFFAFLPLEAWGQGQPQPMCLPREEMLRQLAAVKEAPVARGLSATGAMVEITASPGGAWTLIATMPKGLTCLIGSGEGWQAVERKPAEEGL